MEFKGTKGKWEADEDHVGSLDDSIHGNLICIIPEHYYPDSRKNWKANALLISKAPELLEMLKVARDKFLDLKYEHDSSLKDIQWEIQQLIKEATEL